MNKSNKEKLFLILSVLMLVIGVGIYATFSHAADITTQNVLTPTSSTDENDYTDAENAIEEAKKTPSKDLIDKAQKEIDKLSDSEKKSKLQAALTAISETFSKESEAETAVETAELNPYQEYVTKAQESVDKLKAGDKKTKLQNRIDAIVIADTTFNSSTEPDVEESAVPTEEPVVPAEESISQAPATTYIPQEPTPTVQDPSLLPSSSLNDNSSDSSIPVSDTPTTDSIN